MKTTLNLDDRLMRKAKQLAAARGVTLTSIVEDALRNALRELDSRKSSYRFSWPTVKGRRGPVDVSDRESLFDVMEGRR